MKQKNTIKGRKTLILKDPKTVNKKHYNRFNNHTQNRVKKIAFTFTSITVLTLILSVVINLHPTNAETDKLTAATNQTLTIPENVAPNTINRETYGATDVTELPHKAEAEITYTTITPKDTTTFTNNPNAAIQYPFAETAPITSPYGIRTVVCTPEWGCGNPFHTGVDIAPAYGTPIQAIAAGEVTTVSNGGRAIGAYIKIRHNIDGKNIDSVYGHIIADDTTLKVGDKVTVGQTIAHVGNTGRSTGPHLHFELHINGQTTDPMKWDKWNTGKK